MRRIWKIWLGALALLPNAPAQAQWGHSRDVYVFEDYVLDLRARMEGWIPGSPNEVRDCSDAQMLCLSSPPVRGLMSVTIPRRCGRIKLHDTYGTGRSSTYVDREFSTPAPYADRYFLLVSNGGRSAFAYHPRYGITAIVIGEEEVVKARRDPGAAWTTRGVFRHRTTFDAFGACAD